MIEIRRVTVAQLDAAPALGALLEEYAAECAIAELGQPQPQRETYYNLEAAGVFFPVAAFDADRLVGFILPIVVPLPHYGVMCVTVESFFVSAPDRKSGAGLELLAAAEDIGRERGARAILVSAPAGGSLAGVLEAHKPYRRSNEVFVRGLA